MAAYSAIPVVRLPNHDASLIKRYLDMGASNLLVPMVDNPAQAEAIVSATRYPMTGIRGGGRPGPGVALVPERGVSDFGQHGDQGNCANRN